MQTEVIKSFLTHDNIPNHLELGNSSTSENAIAEITKYTFSQPAPIPESTNIALLGIGLAVLAGVAAIRRRKKNQLKIAR